jgi:DNA topoisomerase I
LFENVFTLSIFFYINSFYNHQPNQHTTYNIHHIMSKVIIVESPNKIKKIKSFIGSDYVVVASCGHIRELTGIAIDSNYDPSFSIIKTNAKRGVKGKEQVVSNLRKVAQHAKVVYLAMDEDREGEGIAYHIREVLKDCGCKFERITFTEITKKAINSALAKPIFLNMDLVHAQMARQILDQLIGFQVSPILRKHICFGTSAGRVQSPSLKLIAERHIKSSDYKSDVYFTLNSSFAVAKQPSEILNTRFVISNKMLLNGEQKIMTLLKMFKDGEFVVASNVTKPTKRNPPKPFETISLQRDSSSKLHLTPKQTMIVAQHLYEAGHITYMRTDSINLSDEALDGCEKYIKEHFGAEYSNRKQYKTKTKNAQEAHEAIRPTHIENDMIPVDEDGHIGNQEVRLYNLIWKRTVASQMTPAEFDVQTIVIQYVKNPKHKFSTSAEKMTFDGYRRLYIEFNENDDDGDGEGDEDGTNNTIEIDLKVGDKMLRREMVSHQKYTPAPVHFSETSIVTEMNKIGIGRPSTIASFAPNLIKKNFVRKENIKNQMREAIKLMMDSPENNSKLTRSVLKETYGGEKNKLVPTELGMKIITFLNKYYSSNILNYKYTAGMEEDLDKISNGEKVWNDTVHQYFSIINEINLMLLGKEPEMRDAQFVNGAEIGIDSETGYKVFVREGKYGDLIQVGEKDVEGQTVKYVGIPKEMTKDDVTMEIYNDLKLYPIPVGTYKDKSIKIHYGQYGFYLKYCDKNYSVSKTYDEVRLMSIDDFISVIEEKDDKFKPLRIVQTQRGVVHVLNGRYGIYFKLIDNNANFSIPKTENYEAMSVERFVEIMEIPKTSTFNTLNKVANDSKRGRGRGSRGRGGKTRGRGQPTE